MTSNINAWFWFTWLQGIPHLKELFCEKRFSSNEEVITDVQEGKINQENNVFFRTINPFFISVRETFGDPDWHKELLCFSILVLISILWAHWLLIFVPNYLKVLTGSISVLVYTDFRKYRKFGYCFPNIPGHILRYIKWSTITCRSSILSPKTTTTSVYLMIFIMTPFMELMLNGNGN